jgi:adenine-specific DNA-methyltransferase
MPQNTHTDQLNALISLFSANIAQYKSGQYDEANTRTDFIDKFFALLDWDISNGQGFSESYREVVREDKVKIDGSKKAPDYSFRIGGVRKFFVEAKKPSVNIKDATEPAYQVRRYAYTAKLPLSVLTNFAEFAVYDTRIKPNKNDNAGTARIFYCAFNQYEQHFDFISGVFSKDSILKGSFDKYVEENKNKKGTSEVDAELLALVEEWRMELAKNIAKNNSALSVYDLNTVVQRIIDRIIFIRIAEDKGIEDENLLFSVAKAENVYEKLIHLFAKANAKYNSGLFAGVDWIDKVNIDDKVLSHIIVNLYYPDCPYEFSVLPVEILGSIYERFLGKTIRFRTVKGDTHTAIIEEKPEVKKAGGVYYTPQYIVDYIVQNTVGEKIKNKTPQEISDIRILDPACGSGSFLVGAYQYLLDYHLDYYTQEKNIKTALKNEKVYEAAFQSYKLTIEEKQRILTNAIYGVDIDNQAVEVTKLSLYLKLLENEGKEAEGWLFRYTDKTLLPSLENNIKCGNSLIGTDFYAQPDLELTDDDRIKVNCFDWEKEFGEIGTGDRGLGAGEERTTNDTGLFDVVIGNPPYETSRSEGISNNIKYYFTNKYKSAEDKFDYYIFFMEQSSNLVKNSGCVGLITPNTYFMKPLSSKIRLFLLENHNINKIVDFNYGVFKATVMTSIIIYEKDIKPNKNNKIFVNAKIPDKESLSSLNPIIIKQSDLKKTEGYYFNIYQDKRFSKIYENIKTKFKYVSLGNLAEIYNGIQTGNNNKYISTVKPNDIWQKILTGRDINRYTKQWGGKYIYYKPEELHSNQRYDIYKTPEKIIIRQTADRIIATYDTEEYFTEATTFIIKQFNKMIDYLCLLGILNSNLFLYFYRNINNEEGRILPQIKKKHIFDLPIITGYSNKHKKIVSLVDKMLELKQKETAEENQQLKTMISRQIEGIDKAIDTAVYGLYNLTEDEIKVVEG